MNAATRRFLALVVLVLAVYWFGVVLAMHVVEPAYDPLKAPLSAYVLGASGSWMTTTYFAAGVAMLCVAYGLRASLPPSAKLTAAFACYVVSAIAVMVEGLFHMDYPPPPVTLAGKVHGFAGLTYVPLLPTAVLLFSMAFRGHGDWRDKAATGVVLALSIYLLIALVPFGLVYPALFGYSGLSQRLYIVLHTTWIILAVTPMLRAEPKENNRDSRARYRKTPISP
jgi:hypothetical protein